MSGFTILPQKRCDIILTQEEYELILRHRAMKRWAAEYTRREAARRRLGHRFAQKRLIT